MPAAPRLPLRMWSVLLIPGQILSIRPQCEIRLTNVSLPHALPAKDLRTTLRLAYEQEDDKQVNTVICNLSANHFDTFECDVRMYPGGRYLLDVQGIDGDGNGNSLSLIGEYVLANKRYLQGIRDTEMNIHIMVPPSKANALAGGSKAKTTMGDSSRGSASGASSGYSIDDDSSCEEETDVGLIKKRKADLKGKMKAETKWQKRA